MAAPSSSSSSMVRQILKEKVKEIREYKSETLGATGTSDDPERLLDILTSQLERAKESCRPVPLEFISSLLSDLITLRQSTSTSIPSTISQGNSAHMLHYLINQEGNVADSPM